MTSDLVWRVHDYVWRLIKNFFLKNSEDKEKSFFRNSHVWCLINKLSEKYFLGTIVIQYSLVAEVFEAQDDLQGWTEAFDEEDSKVNV